MKYCSKTTAAADCLVVRPGGERKTNSYVYSVQGVGFCAVCVCVCVCDILAVTKIFLSLCCKLSNTNNTPRDNPGGEGMSGAVRVTVGYRWFRGLILVSATDCFEIKHRLKTSSICNGV